MDDAKTLDALQKIGFELEQANRIRLKENRWDEKEWGYD